jgi:DNA-binding XRE family transcriptional regulator
VSYRPPAHRLVKLRSATQLDTRMRRCDVNASELAAAVGVTRQTISLLRRGVTTSTSIVTARLIAETLQIDARRLFVMPPKSELARIEERLAKEDAAS